MRNKLNDIEKDLKRQIKATNKTVRYLFIILLMSTLPTVFMFIIYLLTINNILK